MVSGVGLSLTTFLTFGPKMTDITKCTGDNNDGDVCSKREECWRYFAPCSEYQSFFLPPEMGEKCDYILEILKT